nr:MFS transporter [Dongshaea marina]
MTKTNVTIWFYLVLSVCLVTPLSNDLFLPSLPSMAEYFKTPHIQWVMSVFLIGLAVPQLLYGPLFDRFGRKPVLMGGLLIFTLASIAVATSTHFYGLLTARFFQAIGACCSVAGSMAIARDLFDKKHLVKVIAMIMLLIGVCPVLSPLLGAIWRAGLVGGQALSCWLPLASFTCYW